MKEKIQDIYDFFYSARSGIYIALLSMIIIVLSTKGIMNESVVSLQGDMPRYVMNGVYFYDLIRDLPITDPFEHAYRYFARYPALSLGHHPILLGVAEVPFYFIFGISIFAARLTIVFFMLLAAIAWFLFLRSVYDETVAFLSSLLFVTTPFIVEFSRIVMSEIPTLAFIILSTYLFYQYCKSDKKKYVVAFVISATCSVYAKHVAIFVFPVFLCYFLITKGVRKLISKEVIMSCVIIAALMAPLALITLKFSKVNVSYILNKPMSSCFMLSNGLYHIKAIWTYHLILPVVILSLISIPVWIYRRDDRVVLFLFWIVGCYVLTIYFGTKRPRDSIYWIPVFSLFAATTVDFFRYRSWKVLLSIIFLVLVGYQFILSFRMEPTYASGYEEAAKYIVQNEKGESVLYSSVRDSGYFIFFVRKHDPDRDLIVLRSDKILATSRMYRVAQERITEREEIYEILNDYGVGYVVIEDTETGSRSLEWLREEVQSKKFVLCKKVTLHSSSRNLNKIPLAIYKYKDYKPPKEGKILHMNIPLIGNSVEISFKDLLQKN